jgi:hypothetical protein
MSWTNAGFLAAIAVAGCGAPGHLPENTRPLAVCAYNTLKTMPGITKVDAFDQRDGLHGKDIAVIAYSLTGKDGKPASGALDLLLAPTGFDALNFSIPAKESQMEMLDDISGNADFFGVDSQVAKQCQAGFGYVDQVLAVSPAPPPQQKVDMVRYVSGN